MKIVKTYVLSEKTLDKDIDKFIRDAKEGAYSYDYKYGMDGLKIIKQYFKLIQIEFDNNNYEICRNGYRKLLFFLFTQYYESNYFDYEDIFHRARLDVEKLAKNYFFCLIKLCDVRELFKEYLAFLDMNQNYDLAYVEQNIKEDLIEKEFKIFERLLIAEAEKVKPKDYGRQGMIYFILEETKKNRDKSKYIEFSNKFEKTLGCDKSELIKDYDNLTENAIIGI